MTATILVTGGAGYVGSHACKALAGHGFLPITFDNLSTGDRHLVRWGPLEIGDILDTNRLHEVIARHRPEAVMHFAALALVGESVAEPSSYWRTNVTGTLNVLDVCRSHGIEVAVLSSTCAVYGIPEQLPIVETSYPEPVNAYGASKLAAEQALIAYQRAYNLRGARLRYFNAAGADPEGEAGEMRVVETHLIPLALDAILGRRPPLKIMGTDYPTRDGTAIRDYVHVTDLAEAHVAALSHLRSGGQPFVANLGAGIGYSVQEVVTAVERITGRQVPCQWAERRPGDPPNLVADPDYAIRLLDLDFELSRSLDLIIETAWRWRCQPESYRAPVSPQPIQGVLPLSAAERAVIAAKNGPVTRRSRRESVSAESHGYGRE